MCVDARIKRPGKLQAEYVEEDSDGEEAAGMRQRLLRLSAPRIQELASERKVWWGWKFTFKLADLSESEPREGKVGWMEKGK